MFEEIFSPFHNFWQARDLDIIKLILIVIVVSIALSLILRLIKKYLFKKVKTRQQQSNVVIFIDLMKYFFILLFIILVLTAYSGTWGDIGFVAGLLTVAIGWALQKPISGVVAWLIIVTRRPIHIGDRVILMGIKGDISNITLTHIFLDEVGGTINGEECSGRTVMIPTSIIFENEVINYTEKDDFILDEINTSITYESDLKKAEKLVIESVKKIMLIYWENFPKRISKEIHREIHKLVSKDNNVDFAYPHTEVLMRRK